MRFKTMDEVKRQQDKNRGGWRGENGHRGLVRLEGLNQGWMLMHGLFLIIMMIMAVVSGGVVLLVRAIVLMRAMAVIHHCQALSTAAVAHKSTTHAHDLGAQHHQHE